MAVIEGLKYDNEIMIEEYIDRQKIINLNCI